MYLDHFGLDRKPFLISPDPDFLYPSRIVQESFAHLRYGLQREGGFLLLTGEVGTGKTTLCRLLIDELPEQFRLAYILNAQLDSLGLLRSIIKELHINPAGKDNDLNSCMELLYEKLLEGHAENRQTLVIIEEAQNLSPEVLEALRLLTNLETSTTKLLHILLIGQPELLDTLARTQLRQLNQRVVSRCHLSALTRQEVTFYLKHRLKIAGREEALFTKSAINAIYRYTGGLPRLINLLAEHTLMGAYAKDKQTVNYAVVKRAAHEVFGTINPAKNPKISLTKAECIAFICIAATVALFATNIAIPGNALQPISRRIQGEFGNSSNPSARYREASVALIDFPQAVVRDTRETSQPDHQEEPKSGVFARWVSGQGLPSSPASLTQACELAEEYYYRCDVFNEVDIGFLKQLERKALVTLLNRHEGKDFHVLNELSADSVTLNNGSGEQHFTINEFARLWDRSVTVLWQPPAGFEKPLFPGERNEELLHYIQSSLTSQGLLNEELITGGVYSDYLVQKVKDFQHSRKLQVDGIVGAETLLNMAATKLSSMPVIAD